MTRIEPIGENIYGLVAPCGDDVEVRALLVCGDRASLLIDTLLRPADLHEARALVESRGAPLFIANSHADWDHWWGNAAFPDAPVIGHRLALERQLKEGARALRSMRQKNPEVFANVELRPVTIAFDGELVLDLGGLHVDLSLLPGHTRDCTVAYIRERRLLFAADAAEDPIPLVNEGPIGDWPDRLDTWADRATVVVPAHGPVSGPQLLRRNATYLRGLGHEPGRAVPELEGALPFYRRAHRRNARKATG